MPYGVFRDEFKEELSKLAIEIEGEIRIGKGEYSYPNCIGKFNEKLVDIEMFWEVGATFLKIYLLSDFGFDLSIERETTGSHVFKKIGMVHEARIDCFIVPESFNEKYLIKGKPEDKIREFLSHTRVVHKIESLEPFIRLTIKIKHIISKFYVETNDDFAESRMMQIISSLYALSELA